MIASEKLKALQFAPEWPDPDFSQAQGDEVWKAIVAIVEGAEQLPALFDVIEGNAIRTLSFVPLLDVLELVLRDENEVPDRILGVDLADRPSSGSLDGND